MHGLIVATRRRGLPVLLVAIACGWAAASAVAQADDGTPHLYFFTNHGCAPCRQVEPGIQALVQEGYPVTTVILNEHPEWGQRFQVNRTPTVVLVANQKIVRYHPGLIDGVTLKQWFATVGMSSGTRFAASRGGTKVSLGQPDLARGSLGGSNRLTGASRPMPSDGAFVGSATMLKGTRIPANENERRALNATVRLKVEDPEGISYATGTVIHRHDGECLVMTCGHVFRDSKGTGKITAEYGFANGNCKSAPGQMIAYDSQARDIGLVVVQTDENIEPVQVAQRTEAVDRGQTVFSLGCDQGDCPTIRHSQIKKRAAYDGAIKYDIYGRPVNGRSGGGLFNADGELIGVCNAAAVDEDEGIYTALETVHWQIAAVNLDHLFEGNGQRDNPGSPVSLPVAGADQRTLAGNRSAARPGGTTAKQEDFNSSDLVAIAPRIPDRATGLPRQTPASWNPQPMPDEANPTDMEVIIIVRSKSNPARTEAITVSHPSPQLLDYLAGMGQAASQPRRLDVAQLRRRIAFEEISSVRTDSDLQRR